jgi:hypothetical protein
MSGQGGAAPAIDNDDIGGVVTGAQGPEAGVWVIAETRSTPTRLIKSVVTDDRGRFVVPDLPSGEYDVWVRGYGLVDSPKVKSSPGKVVNLKAVPAPDKKAAAQYYPALYWFSLLQVPPKSDFPGTGDKGNGISPNIKSQGEFIRSIVNTDGCTGCHQMGGPATRTIPSSILSQFEDTKMAWDRRIQSGQAGGGMSARFTQVGRARALAMYADWTDRIAKGELPSATPARPQGIERNVVVTTWDWADPKVYLHDAISSDKRNPTVNANGPIYGALEESGDYFPVVDPKTNTASMVKVGPRDADTPSSADQPPAAPSPYWADETIWNSQTTVHSFAMDKQGRVWAAARVRKPETPKWCQAGSDHPSAKLMPINQGQRGLIMYDPKTKKVTQIDTCFTWGHLNFDDNDVIWSSFGPAGIEGWFDVKTWDKTHDEKASQGWSAFVVDNNGNGKRDGVHRAESAGGSDQGPALELHVLRRLTGAGWFGVGNRAGRPGRPRTLRPRSASAGDRADGVLRSAVEQPEGERAGLCAARHGRRQQGRRLDSAFERPACELRSEEVHGHAERSDRDGPAVRRRVDALSAARPELQGRG